MLPYPVFGDRGGENVLVANYMLQNRGLGRQSYTGESSRFNTRYILMLENMVNN